MPLTPEQQTAAKHRDSLMNAAKDLSRVISRIDTLSQALDHYAPKERSFGQNPNARIYHKAYADAFEAIAHNLRQILAGEAPDLLRPSQARIYEAPEQE